MQSSFEKLVTVVFEHDYFSQQRFTALEVNMLPDTRTSMVNHGLIFRRMPDGFSIFYDTEFAGSSRAKDSLLQEKITLSFSLSLTDAHFYNYTGQLPGDISQSVFYFSNNRAEPVLHARQWVSDQDVRPAKQFTRPSLMKPFGWLDVALHQQLAEKYVIRFQAKQTFWQYIVVSDYLKKLERLAVMDAQAKEVFNGPETILLPDNRNALSFISKTPIPLSDSGAKTFQLVENYDPGTGKGKVVHAALPRPDVQVISSAVRRTGADPFYSEIFIY
jgi:hypothetical protein